MISPNELAELWRKHSSGLKLLVRARLVGPSGGTLAGCDSDDLVQEAFIRLSQQSRVPAEPLAWLARTARNLAIDACRSSDRRKQRELAFATMRAEWFQPDSLSGLMAEEATEAMRKLPVLEREILVAHLWNSLSFRQIAAVFDMSSSSANRHYQSALSKMRLAIEGRDSSNRQTNATQP